MVNEMRNLGSQPPESGGLDHVLRFRPHGHEGDSGQGEVTPSDIADEMLIERAIH